MAYAEMLRTAPPGIDWRALEPVLAGDPGRHGLAAPLTLPSAPTVPIVPPPMPLPLSYGDERWDPTRLTALLPVELAAPPGAQEKPEPPGDVSRIVVGYLRTAAVDDEEADEALVATIAEYARERGLTLLRVHRDDVTDDDARRPGFSACLRHLYLREASAIVIPSWDHLAPNEVLRRALCHNATSAGGTIQVVRPS